MKLYRKNILIFLSLIILWSFPILGCKKGQDLGCKTNFYLKSVISCNKITTIKERDDDNKDNNFSLNYLSKTSPMISFGLGYYLNDYVRIDLLHEHFNFYFNDDANSFEQLSDDTLFIGTKIVKRKAYGKSLMINLYIDILKRRDYSVFIGTGVGVATLKEKLSNYVSGNSINNGESHIFPLITENFTSCTSRNFSHSLMLGTNVKLNSQINLELSYSWRDFGKAKYNQEVISPSTRYKGHHFSAGLRFDL